MSRLIVIALLCAPALSACAGKIVGPSPQPGMDKAYSQSIGFTSIGYEPF